MEKKQCIILAALEVLSQKGLEKTKISDIAQKAGIAQGTFYLYFPSKHSVMPAIAEVMVSRMLEALEAELKCEDTFDRQLNTYIHTVFQFVGKYREQFALVSAGLAVSGHLNEWSGIYKPYTDWVADWLRTAIKQGTVRKSLDAKRAARLVIGSVESAAEQVCLYEDCDELEIRAQIEEVYVFIKSALGVSLFSIGNFEK
nr:TetR family transcriptional regulator [Paenibacillus tyrfis]